MIEPEYRYIKPKRFYPRVFIILISLLGADLPLTVLTSVIFIVVLYYTVLYMIIEFIGSNMIYNIDVYIRKKGQKVEKGDKDGKKKNTNTKN